MWISVGYFRIYFQATKLFQECQSFLHGGGFVIQLALKCLDISEIIIVLETLFSYRFDTKSLLRHYYLARVSLKQIENIFYCLFIKTHEIKKVSLTYFSPIDVVYWVEEGYFQNILDISCIFDIKKLQKQPRRCSVRKGVLRNFANSLERTCARVLDYSGPGLQLY